MSMINQGFPSASAGLFHTQPTLGILPSLGNVDRFLESHLYSKADIDREVHDHICCASGANLWKRVLKTLNWSTRQISCPHFYTIQRPRLPSVSIQGLIIQRHVGAADPLFSYSIAHMACVPLCCSAHFAEVALLLTLITFNCPHTQAHFCVCASLCDPGRVLKIPGKNLCISQEKKQNQCS